MGITVYLSPSLQEHNLGAGNYGTEEQRMNEITDVVQRELNRYGVTTYRNRPEWSLTQVVNDSNEKDPDLHFSIHSNAGGGRGCEVYAYSPGGDGERAAGCVYAEMEPLTPSQDRGVKFNPGLYELRATKATAVLIEIAFHDNPDDVVWIVNNIEGIGIAIAKGILKYFGISYLEEKPNTEGDEILKLLDNVKVQLDKIKEILDRMGR